MNSTLIQHTEHNIDCYQRRGDENRLVGQGCLECLRSPLETAMNTRRQADFALGVLDGRNRIAERFSRSQVEGKVDRWKLTLVRDHQRRGGRRIVRKGA